MTSSPPKSVRSVEERLSTDPASRQLLDELRSVSQAMKGLPTASLGADLRESVLRRAERAMLIAKDAGSTSRPNEVAHRLPVGRSKRAWIWAGMALAAGLMLMFIEREAGQNAGLPQKVAMKEPAAAAQREPMGPLTVRALDVPAEEPLDAAQSMPSLSEAPRSEVTRGAAVSSEATLSREAAEAHSSGGRADDVARYGGVGGFGGGMESPGLAGVAADGELLVVHVSVTPEAMRNRAFDTTLLKNQIQVEQDARELDSSKSSDELEVVVVEAAPSQVYSTLADIKADTKNYVGIAVEKQLAPLASTLAKKSRAADVQQFNRGRVANQQQVQFDPQLRNYYIATDSDMYFRSRQLSARDQTEGSTRRHGVRGGGPRSGRSAASGRIADVGTPNTSAGARSSSVRFVSVVVALTGTGVGKTAIVEERVLGSGEPEHRPPRGAEIGR